VLRFKYILIIVISIIVLIVIIVWQGFEFRNLEIKNISQENSQKAEQIKPKIVLLVGDIMLDRKVESLMLKNGFSYPFEKINQFLNQSDGVFGNLEGPISKNPLNFSDDSLKFAFKSDVIESLASANFKILSLANNHTLNMGYAGLEETKQLLGRVNIDWVGDPLDCSRQALIKHNLIFLAFNKTFPNCKNDEIIEIVKSFDWNKFLIVSIHWGEEYKLKSNSAQQELVHKIIEAGADLVIGHHPHVVQEIEKYEGKLIFYSLGNFIFDQYFSQETQEGLVVGLEIYPSKILYKLFPIESNLSQPSLMESEKAKIFLEKRGVDSTIEIEREERVCFEEDCFYVELAQTPEQRNRGLMFRNKLEENRGMLFVFDHEGVYSFWMKNTFIPLDIIWLNENKEVVYIEKNAQPCLEDKCPSFKPDKEAKYVLEINGGMVDKIGLKLGDYLTFW